MSSNTALQLLLLYTTVFVARHSVEQGEHNILYVKPKNDSSCPDGVSPSQCQTLDWYSHNVNTSFTSNMKIVFLEGNHTLESFITAVQCHNFTVIGCGSISRDSDGLPQPASRIFCKGHSRRGLLFINSTKIHISNIRLDNCSVNISLNPNFTVHFALAFHNVNNLTLSQVAISNTLGFGLHCENVFGYIRISSSVFQDAKGDEERVYGGNTRLWFGAPCSNSTSNVMITNSWFMYGTQTGNKYENSNASGLQVFINCADVHVTMDNIKALGNKGGNGGNLALSITDLGSDVGTITINNSNISNGWAHKGGGLRFWSHIRTDTHKINKDQLKTVVILSIVNTTFKNNTIISVGGAMYIAHYEAENYKSQLLRQINIEKCTFEGNRGNGAVMEILKQTIPGYIPHITPQFSVYISECLFDKNYGYTDTNSSIMNLIGAKNVNVSNSNFTNCHGTVISLRSSNLNLYENIRFENNNAIFGGALKVCDSSIIYLHNGTNVLFMNNNASKGGAIYAQQGCLDTAPACFVQPAPSEDVPIEDFAHFFQVTFVNNSASLAGDAIYGGSIDFCYTMRAFSYNKTYKSSHCKEIFKKIFNFSEQNGSSFISSDPRGVCFCDADKPSCKERIASTSKYPGETFHVLVSAVGQHNGTTTGVIDVHLNKGLPNDELKRINSTIVYKGCVSLSYRVLTNKTEDKEIVFTVISSDVNAYYHKINASLQLTLLQCPVGFYLSDITKQCECSPALSLNNNLNQVSCDIDTNVLTIPPNSQLWIGYDVYDNGNQSAFNSNRILTASGQCIYYCKGNSRIQMDNETSFDNQCLFRRSGVLCGACKHNFSRVFGSFTKCKSCSNKNLMIIIPTLLLSGFFVVILLGVLNITVTEGTVNALVIYANIIYTYSGPFHSHALSKFKNSFLWKFIALINFSLGFNLCFYNGMDGYQYTWFLYGYMFYFFVIQGVIIYLCRRYILFTRLFGKNIIKVLATLVFLLYSPLTKAIMQTIQCTNLHIFEPNSTKKRLVWHYDGNIQCFGVKHMPLFIVSILCAGVMCWFMLSLLFVQCLQRSSFCCFRWIEKSRPFFEAFTGPCRDHYRFWPGFLMLMRTGMYLLNTSFAKLFLSPLNRNLSFYATSGACMIILTLSCAFPRGVYKKWPLNMLEFSIILNLLITSVLWTNTSIGTLYISTTVAFFTFFVILLYHIGVKLRSSWFKTPKLKMWLSKVSMKITFKHYDLESCCCQRKSQDHDETKPLLVQPLPPVIQYEHYREPLIGDTNQ